MRVPLALLAFALLPSARAQTYLVVEHAPPGVRVIDVTAGALLGERLINLAFAQPPVASNDVYEAIAVGSEIWVSAASLVYRFDSAGNQLGAIGPFSPVPRGMAVVGGSVWVAAGNMLHQIAPSGTLIASHPAFGAYDVVDFNGRILVSSVSTIDHYDLNGQFLFVFASGPVPSGSYFGPRQLAVDPATGNLLVESIIKLYEFDPAGFFVAEYEAGVFEQGVAPLDDGRLLVTLNASTAIFDPASGVSVMVPGSDLVDLRALSLAGPAGGTFQRYCTANANTTGQTGRIGAFGSASVSTDTFALHASRVPPNQFGYFFYGPNVAQLAWGDGVLCTGPLGLQRILPGLPITGSGVAARDVSFAALPPGGAILPGSTWSLQFVFRDPSGGPAGFNATDAVRLVFQP